MPRHDALPSSSPAAAPSTALGVLTVVFTLAGWSSVPLFLRDFAEVIDPWTSNGWRYGFSALIWLPVVLIALLRRRLPRGLFTAALIPSIVNAAGQVCFTYAHYVIDPALLTFGLRSQLVFVAVGAWIMFPRERAVIRTPGFLIGAGLLIFGVVGVLVMDDHATHAPIHAGSAIEPDALRASPAAHALGVSLAVLSGLLFAAYGLSVRTFMHGVNPVLAFGVICQYTAAAMLVLMLILGGQAGLTVLKLSGEEIFWLLVSAVVGIALGHVFYYISIARLGVAVTAGVLQLQPFFVAIGSMTLFNERLTIWQWLGGCVAVLGAMLMLYVQWLMSRRVQAIEDPLAIAEGESGG